jgi:hypothetical protein
MQWQLANYKLQTPPQGVLSVWRTTARQHDRVYAPSWAGARRRWNWSPGLTSYASPWSLRRGRGDERNFYLPRIKLAHWGCSRPTDASSDSIQRREFANDEQIKQTTQLCLTVSVRVGNASENDIHTEAWRYMIWMKIRKLQFLPDGISDSENYYMHSLEYPNIAVQSMYCVRLFRCIPVDEAIDNSSPKSK